MTKLLAPGVDLEEQFRAYAALGKDLIWLDSAIGDAELGRRSTLVIATRSAVSMDTGGITVTNRLGKPAWIPAQPSQVWRMADQAFKRACSRHSHELGWVGYVAYEAGPLADPGIPERDGTLPFPMVRFDAVSAMFVRDSEGTVSLVLDDEVVPEDKRDLASWVKVPPPPEESGNCRIPVCMRPRVRLIDEPDPDVHQRCIEQVRDEVTAGRVYQGCYTFPIWFLRPKDMAAVYTSLRCINPGDYGAFVRMGNIEAASASPERFWTIADRTITARPMKGTRPRVMGRDEETKDALYNSAKDRAENVMIVDLLRNDLGRVCEPHSVTVPELFAIETYATVFQMTSTVTGTLQDGIGPFSVLQATFPPGSMTGAPKVEACKLLDEVECAPRGLYGGSIGWMGYDGSAQFSVVIRTLQAYADVARWDVGGGIVADSSIEDEWQEALTKSTPILRISALCSNAKSQAS